MLILLVVALIWVFVPILGVIHLVKSIKDGKELTIRDTLKLGW
jgi:hypothetical protein